jgi:hypothetical protein
MFNSVIQAYDLREIALSGGGYTWSNPTLERLDIVLMSKDWETLFPKVCVHKLPRDFSDHNPLIMATLCHQNPKVKKGEMIWLQDAISSSNKPHNHRKVRFLALGLAKEKSPYTRPSNFKGFI